MTDIALSQPDLAVRKAQSDNASIALGKALLAILVVVGAWQGLAFVLKPLIGDLTIADYTVRWTPFITGFIALAVIAWVKLTRGEVASLGLSRPRSYWKGTLTGVVGTVGIFAFIILVMTVLNMFGLMPQPPEGLGSNLLVSGPNMTIALVAALAIMWFNAAFGEELVFRGFLMNNLERALGAGWFSGVVAAAVIAVIFGMVHVPSQGMYGLVVPGAAGFGLGVLFLIAKRNLYPVVIAHGLINTVSLIGMLG